MKEPSLHTDQSRSGPKECFSQPTSTQNQINMNTKNYKHHMRLTKMPRMTFSEDEYISRSTRTFERSRHSSMCCDSPSWEQIPVDLITGKTTRLVYEAFSCSVWSANDSSQRAVTNSDLCFYFPQSAGSHGCRTVWCLVPRDVNQHSFNLYPGGCVGSLNWLPMQLSRLTRCSTLLCRELQASDVCLYARLNHWIWESGPVTFQKVDLIS